MTNPWYVGEQIELLAKYTPPDGTSVSSQFWSVGGKTVGGFNDESSGGYTPTNFENEAETTSIGWPLGIRCRRRIRSTSATAHLPALMKRLTFWGRLP